LAMFSNGSSYRSWCSAWNRVVSKLRNFFGMVWTHI